MKPLTLDELKALHVGDWVWLIDIPEKRNMSDYRRITRRDTNGMYLRSIDFDGFRPYESYGTKWLAYKNKEMAEILHYGNVKQAVKEFAEELKEIFKTKHAAVIANVACNRIDELLKEKFGKEVRKE